MKKVIWIITLLVFITGCKRENTTTDVKTEQDKKSVRTVQLNIDMTEEEKLQKVADEGYQPWRNNPIDVAQAALINAGVDVKLADCKLLSEDADKAVITANDERGDYKIICKRLIKTGGIWTATEVEVTETGNSVSEDIHGEFMDHEHMGHEH